MKNIKEKNTFIFLDFDGVLHPLVKDHTDIFSNLPYFLKFIKKEFLKNKLDKHYHISDCIKVIFTTDWQINYKLSELQDLLFKEIKNIENLYLNKKEIDLSTNEIYNKYKNFGLLNYFLFLDEIKNEKLPLIINDKEFKNIFFTGTLYDNDGNYDCKKDLNYGTRFDHIYDFINNNLINLNLDSKFDCEFKKYNTLYVLDDNIQIFPPLNILRENNYDWKEVYYETYEKNFPKSFKRYLDLKEEQLQYMNEILFIFNKKNGFKEIN